MIKLLTRLKKEWLLLILLIGAIVAQVYFDVTMPTYSSKILGKVQALTKMHEMGLPIDVKDSTLYILKYGGIMLAYAASSMVCSVVVAYIATHLAAKFSRGLRSDVFRKVQSFSFEETNKFSTASLITRSTNDIQQVQMAVMMLLRLAVYAPINAVWAISKIGSGSSWHLTVSTAAWVALLASFLLAVFLVVIPKFKKIQKLTDKLNGVTRENLTGLRVVKAYNADNYQQAKFENANQDVTKLNLFTNKVMGLMNPVMLLAINGVGLTINWVGCYLIEGSVIDWGTMLAFQSLAMQVLMAFMMLLMLLIIVPRASVSAKRVNEVLNTTVRITDPVSPLPFINKGEVEFKNVSFKYPDAEEYVLKDISFKAEKGETVAFIGSTGSGKSTLINLVPRFYDVSEGEVLVDGVNIKDVKQYDLRSKIGYVPQKGVLFMGTVNSNIGYSGEGIEQEKIEEAARISCAESFVKEMPDKYQSEIAQGGKNVSGGQKQRLSIARAVAADPEIYIFDDSFSALDFKTDKAVRENLKTYAAGATKLIVAQRIGTIMDADKIVVLEQGEMVGIGTHKELLQTCGVYKEIALSQFKAEELGL